MAGRPGSGWGFRPGHRRPLRKPGPTPGVRGRDRFTAAEIESIAAAESEGRVRKVEAAVAEGAFSAASSFSGRLFVHADGHVPGKPRIG